MLLAAINFLPPAISRSCCIAPGPWSRVVFGLPTALAGLSLGLDLATQSREQSVSARNALADLLHRQAGADDVPPWLAVRRGDEFCLTWARQRDDVDPRCATLATERYAASASVNRHRRHSRACASFDLQRLDQERELVDALASQLVQLRFSSRKMPFTTRAIWWTGRSSCLSGLAGSPRAPCRRRSAARLLRQPFRRRDAGAGRAGRVLRCPCPQPAQPVWINAATVLPQRRCSRARAAPGRRRRSRSPDISTSFGPRRPRGRRARTTRRSLDVERLEAGARRRLVDLHAVVSSRRCPGARTCRAACRPADLGGHHSSLL